MRGLQAPEEALCSGVPILAIFFTSRASKICVCSQGFRCKQRLQDAPGSPREPASRCSEQPGLWSQRSPERSSVWMYGSHILTATASTVPTVRAQLSESRDHEIQISLRRSSHAPPATWPILSSSFNDATFVCCLFPRQCIYRLHCHERPFQLLWLTPQLLIINIMVPSHHSEKTSSNNRMRILYLDICRHAGYRHYHIASVLIFVKSEWKLSQYSFILDNKISLEDCKPELHFHIKRYGEPLQSSKSRYCSSKILIRL